MTAPASWGSWQLDLEHVRLTDGRLRVELGAVENAGDLYMLIAEAVEAGITATEIGSLVTALVELLPPANVSHRPTRLTLPDLAAVVIHRALHHSETRQRRRQRPQRYVTDEQLSLWQLSEGSGRTVLTDTETRRTTLSDGTEATISPW